MSSATKSSPTLPPSAPTETTTKKKFGKNLNKLTRPPPQASATATKANANSRNGLLLLSTKRPSAGGTNAPSPGGGILASKSAPTAKPLPSLGLQNKSSTSTHDALLGAVVGASRAECQEPDAWGVADKPHPEPTSLANNDESANGPTESEPEPREPRMVDTAPTYQDVEPGSGGYSPDRYHGEELTPSSNWDEYGGRNLNGSHALYNPENEMMEDEQKSLMARKAKDRAEQRRAEQEVLQIEQRERASQKLRELDEKAAAERPESSNGHSPSVKPRTLFDPNAPADIPKPAQPTPDARSDVKREQDPYSRQPVIQLSSYDDRDRGDRGASAAPRMLYDPKSGSMVAVPSRDDSAAGRGRKERGKKTKNSREKEPKAELTRQDTENSKGQKKGKREKKATAETSTPAKTDAKKGKPTNERKLPRTCGVLYARDNRGNLVCVDGCDGDLGYGAHSVPGGKVKNASGYSRFADKRKRSHGDVSYKAALDTSFESDNNAGSEGVVLQTGFPLASTPEAKFDWITPSDKIELVTGIESPTLQATAKEWAPSQAVLAATAARYDRGATSEMIRHTESIDEEDDEDESGPFGLGFDPHLNMDSMMQSPSATPGHGLDTVDLASLSLEPAAQNVAKTNHIFAFGAGSTWGASHAGGSSDTWGAPSSASNAATFLNLPPASGQPWGGTYAFGGTLGSSTVNGDPSQSTGE